MNSTSVRWAAWLFNRAAAMLPRQLRRQHGPEMKACFAEIALAARRDRGRLAVLAVLLGSFADVCARAAAHGALGARDALRDAFAVEGMALDLRHAARRLAGRPSFTSTSILTLGLGFAAAGSVFSLVHGVILNPLPYPDSSRIVDVTHAGAGNDGSQGGLGITYGFYRFYGEHLRGVEAIAMYSALDQTLTGAGDAVRLTGARATASLSGVLRVPAARGRWFSAAEDQPGAPLTVVLSDRLWRERFGADPRVIDRVVQLGGVSRHVIGVMPAGFAFPTADTAFWIPRAVPRTGIGGWNERAVARLAADVDPAALALEIRSLYPALRQQPDGAEIVAGYLDEARVQPLVVPLRDQIVGNVQVTLWVLFGTVGFVLLVALANVANLFLVRAGERQRELAVRRALGASGGRLLRTALAESVLIACASGALAVGATAAAIRVLRQIAPSNIPRLHEVALSWPVVSVLIVITALAGLLLGLVPVAGRRLRYEPGHGPADATRSTTAGRSLQRGRHLLMGTQVALALMLLIGSALLVRSYLSLRAVDLGFAERQALIFEIGLPETRYADRAVAKGFHDRLLEQVAGLPGVAAAGAVGHCLPLSGNMCWGEVLDVEGRPRTPGTLPPVTGARVVAGDYFRAMRIVVRGRELEPGDARGSASAAVLSEAAAEAYFPGEDPIGRRVRFGEDDRWHTIVGVAANVRSRVETAEHVRLIYLPLLPSGVDGPPPLRMSYVLRTPSDPDGLAAPVRAAVAELDPAVPVAGVMTLQDRIDRATAPAAFALTIVGLAAGIALLLGLVGVYAVVTYAVSQRTREIGVRLALGARPSDVRRMVWRQGAVVVLAGAAAGLMGAVGLTRLMAAMLHGVSPRDPASFAALTLVLLAAAGLALWLPARRASRIDPIEALRVE